MYKKIKIQIYKKNTLKMQQEIFVYVNIILRLWYAEKLCL